MITEKNDNQGDKLIAIATEKMIDFYEGNMHDIAHFLKVWALAKTIGEAEGLDGETQRLLEITAVIHDISCPLCREKYGNADGKRQEEESAPLVEAFLAKLPVGAVDVERVKWLVTHHHTYTNVDGIDYRILLEADFLVNAGESGYSREAIENARENVFRTVTGKRLLKSMYLENGRVSSGEELYEYLTKAGLPIKTYSGLNGGNNEIILEDLTSFNWKSREKILRVNCKKAAMMAIETNTGLKHIKNGKGDRTRPYSFLLENMDDVDAVITVLKKMDIRRRCFCRRLI